MKKVVRILLAILMVTALVLSITACKSECDQGNHVWDEGTVTKEATCSEVGKMTYKCTVCDHGQKVEDIPLDASKHTPKVVSVAPTCTEDGVSGETVCEKCGATISAGEVVAKLGHQLSYAQLDNDNHRVYCTRGDCDYTTTAAHRPNDDGSKCIDCGKVLTSGLPSHVHDMYLKSVSEATCTTAKVEHWACTNCGEANEDRVIGESLGHDTYVKSTTEATCTSAAVEHVACHRCGQNVANNEVGSPLGHQSYLRNTTLATCTEAAVEHWNCSRCGVKVEDKTVGEPLGHNTYVKSTTPATCTEAQVNHMACRRCSAKIDDQIVGEALGHNYQGQPWKVSGDTHYQECKNGCNVRNEHAKNMGAYVLVDGRHVSTCNGDATCTFTASHAPALGAYVTTETNHYKECSKEGCDLTAAEGEHSHRLVNNGNTHDVVCSVCGKEIATDVAHVWVLNTSASKAATCTETGLEVYDCACGRRDTKTLETIDHTYGYEDFDEADKPYRKYTCTVCGDNYSVNHELDWDTSDKDTHVMKCKNCDHVLENTRAPHVYGEGEDAFTCDVCGRTNANIVVLSYYNDSYNRYNTLVEAVNAITDNSEAIIYLGQDMNGAGIFIPSNRNITLRLQGSTYTVTSGAVGSTGTETQGFHIEKNSSFTIENGTITSTLGSGVKMLVQNYASLTLNRVILDGSNLDEVANGCNYTLSNNYGSVVMTATTINVKDREQDVALDLWYGSHADYLGGVSVTVGEGCNINGTIEYGSAIEVSDWSNVILRLENKTYTIKFTSDNATCHEVNIKKVSGANETQLAHLQDEDWTCKDDKHFHTCDRCPAHIDEADCSKVVIPAVAVTCEEDGSTEGLWCPVCTNVYVKPEVITALGHKLDDGVITTDPTCTEKGVLTKHCIHEGCTYTVTEDVDALGHNMELKSTTEATCTEDKIEHWACTRCEYSENKTIENTALGHSLDDGVVTKEPTCKETGVKTYTCTRCDYTETVDIDTVGHKLDDGVTTKEATCTETGVKTFTCIYECGHTVTEVIPALGHKLDDGVITTEPTCTEKGVKTYTCTRDCGYTVTEDVDALGHEYATTTWTEISATQHAHKCIHEGCTEYSDATNHVYNNSVCVCGREITVEEIYAIYSKYTSTSISSDGTFTLVGKVVSIDEYSTSGISLTITVTEKGKPYTFYCYKIKDANGFYGDEVQVDDIITIVDAAITAYNSNPELANAKFDYIEIATYSITYNAPEGVTVNGLPPIASRGYKAEFTLDYDRNSYVAVVTINNQVVNESSGKYKFEVTNKDVEISITLYGVNETRPHDNSKTVVLDNKSIGLSGTSYTGGSATIESVTFEYEKLRNNLGIQMNENQDPDSNIRNTMALPVIKSIKITYNSGTNSNFRLKIELANNAEFTDSTELTLSSLNGDKVYNVADQSATFVRFTAAGTGAGYITSIVIECGGNCSNTENFTEHEAQEPDCTNAGTIRYWTCDTCGARFNDELCNNMITDIVDPALGHSVSKVDAKSANCAEEKPGNIEYYECERCHLKFSDAKATTEITNITVPYEHHLVEVGRVAPTKEKEGKEAYWKCSNEGCTACFEDAQGETKITNIDTWGIIDKLNDCEHANFDFVWVVNDGTHSKQCTNCQDIIFTCNEPLAYITDDETHMLGCETCGYVGEPKDHVSDGNYEYLAGGQHISTCTICGYEDYLQDCVPVNGKCPDCGRVVGETSGTEKPETVSFQGLYTVDTSLDGNSFGQDVTLAFYTNTATTPIRYWARDNAIRYYTNNKITISAGNCIITKVVFTGASNTLNPSTGNYSYGTWTGNATSIDFIATANSGFSAITVTYIPNVNCFHDGIRYIDNTDAGLKDCAVDYAEFACWHCDICKMNFDSEACTNAVDVTVREASGHNYGDLNSVVDGDCVTQKILQAYYHCSECDKYFNADKQEITDTSTIFGGVVADAHDYEWKIDADGNHYQQCKRDATHTTTPCDGTVATSNSDGTHNLSCTKCGFAQQNVTCVYDATTHACICGQKEQVQVTLAIDGKGASDATITLKVGEKVILSANGTANVDYGSVVNITVSINEGTSATFASITIGNDEPITDLAAGWNTGELSEDITITVTIDSTAAATWKRINNVNDIDTSSEYILVYEDANVVAGTVISTYMSSVGATINNNEIETLPTNAVIVKIEGTTDNYKLHVYDQKGTSLGYYTTTTAKKMSLGSSGTTCKITFSGNNVSIVFGSNGTLQYNSTDPRFVNYATSQKAIQLYKLS